MTTSGKGLMPQKGYDYYQCDDCDSTYPQDPVACDYCGSFRVEGMMYHYYSNIGEEDI